MNIKIDNSKFRKIFKWELDLKLTIIRYTITISKNRYAENINFKNIIYGIGYALSNPQKSIRDAGISLLREVYIRIIDDASTIIKNLKVKIRPVLLNEILTTLNNLEKQEGSEKIKTFFQKH